MEALWNMTPSWLVQKHKDERTRQNEMQSDLRQSQRDLIRQKRSMEKQRVAQDNVARTHLRNGRTQQARAAYQGVARIEQEIARLDKQIQDVTMMTNSAVASGSQRTMMNATQTMTRAMRSGPGMQEQHNIMREYAVSKEQEKMAREMLEDVMYQSDSDDEELLEGGGMSRADELMQRAQDEQMLGSGAGSSSTFIYGLPDVPSQDPASMLSSPPSSFEATTTTSQNSSTKR